ncbi:toxin-antitoxin system, antitoxin component domain protein [Leptospira yanagawae serovar Saopaulo str. Sao Paulo = ATCC 700523]|uniref:Toxin-antitoxin system, antitoxin component domain protein n=1 Tax=Leptospira yanagawae serovar Saopaulo str. Sao Paulo = ATCC 700523 TaxID=1249483 RepID=A0A5E8HF69_9LEPT|nr:toxin-antitoxin system, antitoxin component domain protein [Leptospira yanagawae serovar Saopaulo str. Sao Paulo = ATCC 700523]
MKSDIEYIKHIYAEILFIKNELANTNEILFLENNVFKTSICAKY